jgi:signal transduction histidine kinase
MIVNALNSNGMIVKLAPDFPDDAQGATSARIAPRLQRLFAGYPADLEERPFRVEIHDGVLLSSLASGHVGTEAPVRLFVRLRSGEVLAVERVPVVLQRFAGRFLLIAAAAAAVLLLVLGACMRQIARPIRDLARAARQFARDISAPDLQLRGSRELKDLAVAFNDMKHTIRGLIDERTRILAAIAHDLRTYLTRLRLRADFIDDRDQRSRAVNDLEEMSHLLDDTLMFTREATPARRSDRQHVDVGAELAKFIAVRQEMGQAADGAATTDDALLSHCSPLALRRMLANLTDNAVRYGGAAHLRAWRDGDQISIAVDDDGPGAPAGEIDRLLAPFERLEPSRGRETGGAGLGLAIVKGLAESQGGSLTIENRAEGGLRAQIRLPAVPEDSTVVQAA